MSAIFPRWTNKLPFYLIVALGVAGVSVVAGVWYYFTPKYTRVGYEPIQPVPFPHSVHVDQLGMDCRYCHNGVEKSWFSNIPAASTCMNCHNQVLANDPRLAPIRDSYTNGTPVAWVQIHKLPEFVYFNHSVHVNRGVSCVECHGQVNQMDEVRHVKPLSMGFCLDCHRDPAARIRPPEKITDLNWKWDQDPHKAAQLQRQFGTNAIHQWRVHSSQYCSSCHR